MKTQAEYVIIGGGVMGVSLAYHLAKLGKSDVVLLEKNELTAGSTWHAAGLCSHFAHNATIQFLRAHSVDLYKNILPEETGLPVGFHSCGGLRITRSEQRLAEFRQVQGLGKFTGYDFTVFSADDLHEYYPLARKGDGLLGGIFEPLDGYVDPSQATHAMAAGARARGVKIYRNNPVEKLTSSANGWRVHTRDGNIEAHTIVNAAGTWCREIGAMLGIDLPVVPMLHQYLVTEGIESVRELDRELPIIRDPEESWYLRQEGDGFILGPYEVNGTPWSIDNVPADFGMELLPPNLDAVESIIEAAMERVPSLAEAGIKTVVNGPITFTPDANPLIGPAYGLRNAWLLTGSSMGVMEGGGAGCYLAEWILNGEPPMDELAVDPRRFGHYANRNYRVAKAIETYGKQFGVHFPHEERLAGRPARTSPLHARMLSAGAVMGCAHGWERPNYFSQIDGDTPAIDSFYRTNWFESVVAECRQASRAVVLADLSPFSKFDIAGERAEAFIESLGVNNAPKRDGSIVLTHALTPSDGVYSEFAVTRFSAGRYYLTSAAAAERRDEDLLRQHAARFHVGLVNQTAHMGVLGVMGPKARPLLQSVTDVDLSQRNFPWLSAQHVRIAGCGARALRVSYIGESGWEVHAANGQLEKIYDAIVAAIDTAGGDYSIAHYGAFAANAMRLEKGYRAWGLDLTTERTVCEAGLDSLVKKELDGRAKGGWNMQLLALDTNAVNSDAFGGQAVFCGDSCVGVVTSGAYGARVDKSLALAYLREPIESLNESLCVELLGQRVRAIVLTEPPYDAENLRMKS